MILPPAPCVACDALINATAENCWLCPNCGSVQPQPEKPPCDWCGKPACGAGAGKNFCIEHKTEGMKHFFIQTRKQR